MKSSRLAVLFLLSLCACSTPPPPPVPLDYGQLEKINLDVKDIDFVDRGVDVPPSTPVMTNQFEPTIEDAIRHWASACLQAVGVSGQAAFIVKNAYITEQALPTSGSWLERPQASKYVAHVEVEVDARGAEGYALATANVTHSVSVPQNPDEEERRRAYHDLIDGIIEELNKYLDQAIHEQMKDFVVTAPIIGSKLPDMPVPLSPGVSP